MKQNKTETDQVEEFKVELLPPTTEVLSTIIKAEINEQIATAKAFPRSLEGFLKKCEELATLNADVAESCAYSLPRKRKNDDGSFQKIMLQGPSIRLAEIVCSTFGNIRTAGRVISNDGRTIVAQGACHDLETNNFVSVEVRRSILNKKGQSFTEDMQIVTGNAAVAIAIRNAVFKVVPAALIHPIFEKVLLVAKGDAATLEARRAKAIKFFTDRKITEEQIFEALEVQGIKDIDLDKLAMLSGMKAAIANQEQTLTDLFPPADDKGKKKADASLNKTDAMINGKK